jgi:replicative DNA helicase
MSVKQGKINQDLGFLGLDYQKKLIAVILNDRRFADKILPYLKAQYFTDDNIKIIVSELVNAFEEHETILDYVSLKYRIKGRVNNDTTIELISYQIDEIEEFSLNDNEYVKEKSIKFCHQQVLGRILKQSTTLLEKGELDDVEKVIDSLNDATRIGEEDDKAINVFFDLDEVLKEDFRKPIPTGITGLDRVMNGGLAKTELGVVLAPFGVGKAQPLDSKILTPNGWTTMGEIKVGDEVISIDGKSTIVTGVFPQKGKRVCYELVTSTGKRVDSDGEHIWYVRDENSDEFINLTTEELKNEIDNDKWYLPISKPIIFNTSKDISNLESFEIGEKLRLNVINGSEINFNEYLYNTIECRLSFLCGFLKFTDNSINDEIIKIQNGFIYVSVENFIISLIRSLGGKIIKNTLNVIEFIIPFDLKDYTFKEDLVLEEEIIGIDRISSELEVQCISVEHDSKLYITEDYIVTHNTTIMTKIASTALQLGFNVLQIFFEDMEKVIQRKHISCISGISLEHLSSPDHIPMIDESIEKFKTLCGKGNLDLLRMSSSETKMSDIRAYIKKVSSRGKKPDIVLLDYIDVVQPSTKESDSNISDGKVMREFESLLSEYDIAGWTAVQGNRSSINADIVDSTMIGGSIKKGQIGHFIMSIAKTLEQKEMGTANLSILKSRFGKDGMTFEDITFNNGTIDIDIDQMYDSNSNYDKSQITSDKDSDIRNMLSNELEKLN